MRYLTSCLCVVASLIALGTAPRIAGQTRGAPRSGPCMTATSECAERKQLAARPVTYLLGALDILPVSGFDDSCPAMAQGPTRFARGIAFGKYMGEKYGAQHKTVIIPSCGHNDRCMFTANDGYALLFPKQP
jgi:hypothetical protein